MGLSQDLELTNLFERKFLIIYPFTFIMKVYVDHIGCMYDDPDAIGIPATGISGFGNSSVKGKSLVPLPPARIIACIFTP